MSPFLAFVVALALTASLLPLLMRLAPVMGLYDAPGPRKVHASPMPRVGGIAMAVGMLLPSAFVPTVDAHYPGLLVGLCVLLVFGIWDDRSELHYRTKFIAQAVAITLAMLVGDIRIESLTGSGRIPLPEPVGAALTFLFLLGVTNAVNLADGLDGLAGGLALLCCCAVASLAAIGGNNDVVALSLIQAGAIVGFLRFNTHPARVFMGDSGSQMLGFNIGALSILATQGEGVAVSAALPLLLVGVPVIDTLGVMAHRIRTGRSPFASDRNHLHHRLLVLGFSHGHAVAIIYGVQCALFLAAYFQRYESDAMIVGTFALFAVALLGSVHYAGRAGWRAPDVSRGAHVPWFRRILLTARERQLPGITLAFAAGSVCLYAAGVVTRAGDVAPDIVVLCLVVATSLGIAQLSERSRLGYGLERAGAYLSILLLVYLEAVSAVESEHGRALSWVLPGCAAVFAALRLWLSGDRRFETTTLDVLVVFIALVVPALPGSLWFPQPLTAGLAKAVVLLYVVEILLRTVDARGALRTALAAPMVAIALRGLLLA